MLHILFLVPYQEIQTMVEAVFAERPDRDGLQPHIRIACRYRWRHEAEPYDAVIARGFTAGDFRNQAVPHVELRVNGYDILAAVRACADIFGCRHVVVVGTAAMVYGAEKLDGCWNGVRVGTRTLERREDIPATVAAALADGADAVVGGLSVHEYCQAAGIPSQMILSGKESISHAVDEAVAMVRLKRQEEAKRLRLRAIMDYSFGGIVSFAGDGRVDMMNAYAAAFFAVDPSTAGLTIDTLMPELAYHSVFTTGQPLTDVLTLGRTGRVVAVNCAATGGEGGAVLTFQDVTEIQELEGTIRKKIHRQGFAARYRFADIIHCGDSMRQTIAVAAKYCAVDANVFLYGETGTGKELFAQGIHNASGRRQAPFVAINCAALPEHLLESELFGYTDGAFTGAARGGKPGLFELAHGGTIFLDEIGDIPLGLQPRLLRVIQEREIMRLGHNRITPVNVRVISASNRNLKKAAATGAFRQDLLHRLDTLVLAIPPLRARREDILPLAEHFLAADRAGTGRDPLELADATRRLLLEYSWPGNVRELRNFCERLGVIVTGNRVDAATAEQVLDQYREWDAASESSPPPTLAHREREHLLAVLAEVGFSRAAAAKRLGIDKSTLWRRMRKHRLL
ncbi:MAG: sigma 54-interacting transcriptional regulator [Planctomycetes bacterium]|nr:sigma 54-interacting transcriptional regulator [Planctomycetota bacterium]